MSETQGKKKEKSKFYRELVKLCQEMKPMTWKQRVDHIWTYYKEYIGLFALLAFVLTGLISSAFQAQKEPVITGILVNVTMEQQGYSYLSTDYARYRQVTEDKEVVLENTEFSNIEVNLSEENYYAAMTVLAEVSAKRLDYMLLDKTAMAFYAGQEVYMDLSKVLTQEELAYFEENKLLIYCQEEGQTTAWPAAVKINDLAFAKDNITTKGDIYFAVAGSSEKLEELRAMWEYINAWTPKEK